jgi:hypothetical protein
LSDIYGQLPVVRCATFATLVYAYESNYWVSNLCKNSKNCFWLRWNGVDTPAWFLTFSSYEEWLKYFAEKYFKWHYKKKISVFVKDWSMTDREVYIAFMNANFWKVYQELENLYFN